MRARRVLKWLPVWLPLICAIAASGRFPVAQGVHPNVIEVLSDDLDVPSFQAALAAGLLPNIKARLMAGAVADNYFTVVSQCCPARAGLLSSLYPQHTVLGNSAPTGGVTMFDEAHALPCWLQASGYRTMHVGKYLNGYGLGGTTAPVSDPTSMNHVPPCWTVWQALDDPSGYTAYDHEWTVRAGGATQISDDRPYGTAPWNYHTDMVTLRTLYGLATLIDATPSAPFYVEVTPATPHFHLASRDSLAIVNACPAGTGAPGTGGGSLWGITALSPARYDGTVNLPLPMAPSFNESSDTLALKPAPINTAPALTATDIECATRVYNKRIEQLRAVDDQVGAIFSLLDAKGLTGRTLVIFTSDNGYLLGDHRLIEKLWLYERSIRVPFAAAGPGVTPHHIDSLLTDRDVAATIADIAGATPTRTPDGRSFRGDLEGSSTMTRYAMPLVSFDSTIDGPPGYNIGAYLMPKAPVVGVRTRSRKALFYVNGPIELYHLDADPDELHNVASDPLNASELDTLRTLAFGLVQCAGASCAALETAVRP